MTPLPSFRLQYRSYPHLDFPFDYKDQKRVMTYISDPKKICHHSFLPLIRNLKITRRYKTIDDKRKSRNKVRELTYASHLDSAIYSYYASLLQEKYETLLSQEHLTDVPVAYRKIPVGDGNKSNKCNIHIANDVFNIIQQRLDGGGKIAALTFDIQGFFDNLDHGLLYQSWLKALQLQLLPRDLQKVFKSITQYAFVYITEVFSLFKDGILCRNSKTSPIKKVKVKHLSYMKDKKAVAFCTRKDMQKIRDAKLIRTHKGASKGIPQGLPISAVSANLYMLDFDRYINQYVSGRGGTYRRYSDDIIVVCDVADAKEIRTEVQRKIMDFELKIQEAKTKVVFFSQVNGAIKCINENDNDSKLEYLGFSFDGKSKLIKDASLGKYYQKMYHTVDNALFWSKHIKNSNRGKLFEGRIIHRFSAIGAHPHAVYVRDFENHSVFKKLQGKKSYGNFTTYANKASRIMNSPAITRQLHRNGVKLIKALQEAKGGISGNNGNQKV